MFLSNWDGNHYLSIAQNGYLGFQYAFFPLYPLLIRILSFLTQNYLLSAIIISLVSTFLSIKIFYRLVSLEFNKEVAFESTSFLLIFPTSFFLLTAYTEGLFLLLAVSTFYFIKKDNLMLATLFAALATATRFAGIALSFALLSYAISRFGFKKSWFVIFSFSGLIGYSIFQLVQIGDPFYFIEAQKHWQRSFAIPGLGFWETVKSYFTIPGFLNSYPMPLVDLIFSIFGVGMVLRSIRFLPSHYALYAIISILIPLTTPSLSSMPRFLLPIFPIFIALSLIKNERVKLIYCAVSLSILVIFSALFINGYWIS